MRSVAAAALAGLVSCAAATTAHASVPGLVVNGVPEIHPVAGKTRATAGARLPGPFAVGAGLRLAPPATRVVRYTYHESMFAAAVPLHPRGRPVLVGNSRFDRPPATPGPRYIVLPSRGRGTGPATAADIVLRRGTPVVAPVSGRVVAVTPYRLYCNKPDTRVIIRPDGRPDLRLVLFHLDRVRLQRGDPVERDRTRLGRVRLFRNSRAQYDDFVQGNHPHIHLEVQRGKVFPLPGCR